LQEEEKRGGKKGRLLGIITLSDVLRYTIGEPGIGEAVEKDEELPASESAGPMTA
jgi:5'-AMP-activated protein kinase, regulatory gamma subunit